MKSHRDENLRLLRRHHSQLAEEMQRHSWPASGVTVVPARNGRMTARVRNEDGSELLLHSEYDPVREAAQWVERQEWKASGVCLLNGFGLGYPALASLSRLDPSRWLVCVEADESVFRAALETVDLTPLLQRERTRIFVGRDLVSFQAWLTDFFRESAAQALHVFTLPVSKRHQPGFYEGVIREIQIAVRRRTELLGSLIRRGRIIERNALRNLAAVRRTHGIDTIKGAFPGTPAVIIGAGPSLTGALPALKEAAGTCILVACDASLKVLISAGIRPDFVVSVDMNESVLTCYSGFDVPPETTLVFHPDCHFQVPLGASGSRMTFETDNRFLTWARKFTKGRGMLERGGSVAHTCLSLACELGADPLILVGIDLSYPDQETHAAGVPVLRRIDRNDPRYLRVPGVKGEPVLTTPGFQGFIAVFEDLISRTGRKVFQTSPIGAVIRGAENVGLEEVIGRFDRRDSGAREAVGRAMAGTPPFDHAAFTSEAGRILEELARISGACEAGLRLVGQFKRLDPANRMDLEEIRKKIARCQAYEVEIFACATAVELLDRLITQTASEILSLREQMKGLPTADPRAIQCRVRQFEVQFSGFKECAEYFAGELKPVRDQILKDSEGA